MHSSQAASTSIQPNKILCDTALTLHQTALGLPRYDGSPVIQHFQANSLVQKQVVFKPVVDGYGSAHQLTGYISLLQRCGREGDMSCGKLIHAQAITTGYGRDRFLANMLMDMYGKLAMLDDARRVFEIIVRKNVFSWTIIISIYSQHGQENESLQLFRQMLLHKVKPNSFTLSIILTACSNVGMIEEGILIHEYIVDNLFEGDVVVENALVNMYGKCGNVEDAEMVFENMSEKNVISWNTMISVYAQHGHGKQSMISFKRMCLEGVRPNIFTFSTIPAACSSYADLLEGKLIHAYICIGRLQSELAVGNALINMYGKCGSMENAREVFEKMHWANVISWTALMSGYVQNEFCVEGLKLFEEMQQKGMAPNTITMITMFDACASLAHIAEGKRIHAYMVINDLGPDMASGTAIVNAYGKCGSVDDASLVFLQLPSLDLVSWSAMISVYAQNNCGKEALEVFWQMQQEGLKPNKVSFVSALDACAILAAIDQGKKMHQHLTEHGFDSDVVVASSIVNMYAKCGSPEDARKVFNQMALHNIMSWSAMLAAYSQNGRGREAIQFFYEIQQGGMFPDKVMFGCILSGCSHAGFITEAFYHLCFMVNYNIGPGMEHYWCLFDLLGRVGWLDEGEDFISNLPFEADAISWMTLLGACRIHGNLQHGRRIVHYLVKLQNLQLTWQLFEETNSISSH